MLPGIHSHRITMLERNDKMLKSRLLIVKVDVPSVMLRVPTESVVTVVPSVPYSRSRRLRGALSSPNFE